MTLENLSWNAATFCAGVVTTSSVVEIQRRQAKLDFMSKAAEFSDSVAPLFEELYSLLFVRSLSLAAYATRSMPLAMGVQVLDS